MMNRINLGFDACVEICAEIGWFRNRAIKRIAWLEDYPHSDSVACKAIELIKKDVRWVNFLKNLDSSEWPAWKFVVQLKKLYKV